MLTLGQKVEVKKKAPKRKAKKRAPKKKKKSAEYVLEEKGTEDRTESKEKEKHVKSSTDMQREVAKRIVSGEVTAANNKHAILESIGYSKTTAQNSAKAVFTSEGVQKALVELGVTPETMLTPVIEAQGATKTTFYQGELVESDAADHAMRLKASELLLETTGLKKTHVVSTNMNVNVDATEVMDLF